MRKIKRGIAWLLTLAMFVGILPMDALAASLSSGFVAYNGGGYNRGTGVGDSYDAEPTFAVYLTDDKFATPLTMNKSLTGDAARADLITQVQKEYSTHYPNGFAEKPVILAAPWMKTGSAILSKGAVLSFDLSNQVMSVASHDASLNYIASLGSSPLNTPVHSAVWTAAKTAAMAGGDALVNFQKNWRDQITPSKFSIASAQNVFSYLLGAKSGATSHNLADRLDAFLTSKASDSKTKDAEEFASYFELVMATYTMAWGVKGTNKAIGEKYAARIDKRFKSQDAQLNGQYPLMVAFEAVGGFWNNMNNKKEFWVSNCTDLASWAAGGTTAVNLRKNPGASNNTLSMLKSITSKTKSGLKRNTSSYLNNIGKTSKYNIVQNNIQMSTGVKFSNGGHSIGTYGSGYYGMAAFNDMGTYWGLSLAVSKFTIPDITPGRGQQDINIDPPKTEVLTDIIGQDTPVDFKIVGATEATVSKWTENATKYPTATYKVKLNITQTEGDTVALTPSGGAPALNTEVSVTWAQLQSLLTGATTWKYNAATSPISIGSGETKTFKFQSTFSVLCSYTPDKTWTVFTPNDGLASKIYWRDDSINYTSGTSNTFGEIKDNYPEEEKWEAMAGVPSTERLYFAVGGHEFLVDVVLEYIEDQTTTRTYNVVYNSVPSGFNMPPEKRVESGSKSKSPKLPPPKQTPADCTGATTTVGWTSSTKETDWEEKYNSKGELISKKPIEWEHTYTNPGYNKTVGGYKKTWTQTVNYDYMKIKQAVVYRIDNGNLILDSDSVDTLGGGKSSIKATIQQGTPTVFANIDRTNTAKGGRLVYSLETAQGDNVTWNMGNSDNQDANSESTGAVIENDGYTQKAALTTEVDVVSDTLILQTSSGDQAVMYFSKHSNGATACGTGIGQNGAPIVITKSGKEAMWDNNSNSASKWKASSINIGSYNGKYSNPSSAFTGTGSGSTVSTVLDNSPFISRPARPSKNLIIAETWKPNKLTENGEYETSDDSNPKSHVVQYKKVFSKDYTANRIDSDFDGESSDTRTYVAEYYKGAGDVNNVVIHDPVSAQDAIIVPLDNARDQRVDGKNILGGVGLVEDQVITKKTLDPNWRSNLLFNPGAEYSRQLSNYPLGWDSKVSSGTSSQVVFTRRVADSTYTLADTASFEITHSGSSEAFSASFYQDIDATAGDNYSISLNAKAKNSGKVRVYAQAVASSGAAVDITSSPYAALNNSSTPISFSFTMPSGYTRLRIRLEASGTVGDFSAFFDSLVLNNMSRLGFIQNTNVIKDISKELNPEYLEYLKNPDAYTGKKDFSYTGSVQTFTAPKTGTYTLEAWGAEGGTSGAGGKGGYSSGKVTLTVGQTIWVYVGGQAGWNGGGSGHGRATDSGGGGTDFRLTSNALTNRILVAGGGGGYGGKASVSGGYGGGMTGGTGADNCGTPGTGGTQSSGGVGGANYGGSGSLGQGGSQTTGSNSAGGGGGGGYYGGGAGGNDYSKYNDLDDSGGGGGSSYVGGVSSGVTKAGNMVISSPTGASEVGHAGNGFARITWEASIPKQYLEIGEELPGGDGKTTTFSYTNKVQTFTAPVSGNYTIELAGAKGHDGIAYVSMSAGLNGDTLTGIIKMTKGDTLSVYTGESPSSYTGGWSYTGYTGLNGLYEETRCSVDTHGGLGGGGGGATVVVLNGVVVFAAKGGSGGYGYPHTGSMAAGGSGGPEFVSGVTFLTRSAASSTGNGYVKITNPKGSGRVTTGVEVDAAYQPDTEPPEEAYITTTETIKGDHNVEIPGQGTFTPGNFINLDHSFEVYYPNTGDFDNGEQWGIRRTSSIPGKGFTDNLDTTKWIKKKVVTFDFNVIYNGTLYPAGEEVVLFDQDRDGGVDVGAKNGYKYEMYCVEGNYEARDAKIEFYSVAINSPYEDAENDLETNELRYSNLAALHSAYKETYIDVVGRIGNMTIMDTTDWRFSNFFKKSTSKVNPYTGLPEVDLSKQNNYISSTTNILGHIANDGITKIPEKTDSVFGNSWLEQSRNQLVLNPKTKLREFVYMGFDRWLSMFELKGMTNLRDTKFMNTYGDVAYKSEQGKAFPLTAAYNDSALATQPMRLGYSSFMDVETIGSYSEGFTQVVPYYYKLNLDKSAPTRNSGETQEQYTKRCIESGYIVPVDIYMSVNGQYKNINKYGVVNSSWDPSEEGLPEDMRFYANTVSLSWDNEKSRRQVSEEESAKTETLAKTKYVEGYDKDGNPVYNQYPAGDYTAYGNNQYLVLTGRNRTLVGSSKTYDTGVGYDGSNNPGNVLDNDFYKWQGQRWHYSVGLPSSAVTLDVLENGTKHQNPSTKGFEDSRKGNWVLLCAVDVQAVGSMWVLQSDNVNTFTDITLRTPQGGTTTKRYDLTGVPQKVVTVISISKTSLDDLTTVGTH